ncbi:hypothetical protein [Vibrio gallaecicus]|uniref:hypothetical protein n=1 Tax=Vibrio gallaecicus TaxID=552386 RepID=UPI0025B28E86|nr:hypothetical protein [Vibrio gallaecicus]MDN3615857.1 hypothetical protein [Vibrio gallaecicus]
MPASISLGFLSQHSQWNPQALFNKTGKGYYFLHMIECRGYPIKLRAARGRALASPWDDYPAYVHDLAKSWKHNSKTTLSVL